MSKASELGAGRFGAPKPVSARRAAIGAATGVPTEGVAAPNTLSVDRISLNPDNPRTALGDLTDLAGSLRDHGQKQAITVMNRDAYTKAHPENADLLEDDTTHVAIDGNCRLAAARDAALPELKVMVDDDQGSTENEILESALVANIHRQDLEPLDEARALARLLDIHGSQTALAKRLHRSQGWVSQRLALLHLTPELQERLGQESIDLLRAVGNKPADEQASALEAMKTQKTRKESPKRRTPKTEAERSASEGRDQSSYYAVIGERPGDSRSTTITSEPQETTAASTPPPVPYDDGAALAQHLIKRVSDTELDRMLSVLNEHRQNGEAPEVPFQAAPTDA